ncbi:MAG: hypothetical protein ACTHKF_05955 [Candidatus Nitrosocosmicus sp.]
MSTQTLSQNSYDDSILISHELAKELRELYDLPSLAAEERVSAEVITNLSGFLKEYATTDDLNESSIDAVKLNQETLEAF